MKFQSIRDRFDRKDITIFFLAIGILFVYILQPKAQETTKKQYWMLKVKDNYNNKQGASYVEIYKFQLEGRQPVCKAIIYANTSLNLGDVPCPE